MSMWEPRSSHLYVGRGGACRLWLLCFLCVRGAGAHTAPLRPPQRGAVVHVCVCVPVFSVLLCTPVCARAFVDLCVHLWFCVCLTPSWVCRAVRVCRCVPLPVDVQSRVLRG